MTLFTCTIPGRAGIKKNSKRLIRRGSRMIPISSAEYMQWEKLALFHVKQESVKLASTISFPVTLNCRFWFENHKNECDLDNLFGGVLDVLQSAEVIANDRLVHSITGQKLFGSEPRVEIEITEFCA
jgi:Holliday junction resolvase RusA-like endonuclease